ncbi:AraC family transcriptional regulator [Rheinheimera pacifica]|uniref:helix-turn-helix domain-containing protein n=1 Tax=Rheinheimera pacifica TaxID=173990 RepID=UPI000CC7EB8E|nr:AraC family transcriptional regulator [Rheinheimera pacifica]MDR6983487.1 AraC family transcriptional regulator [Rheinheimera pacifica]PKM19585.1 MAG: AraC family transcriptional regulator [Gammaproteobacteria bacterium HGW-Gammaproteobacteria-15]
MIEPDKLTFTQWYCEGPKASYLRARKAPGGILDLIEVARPAGDMSRPAVPELVLYQDQIGGGCVRGDAGGGAFDVRSEKGSLYLAAPNFANTVIASANHKLHSLSFPVAHWQSVLDEAAGGGVSWENLRLYRGSFNSPVIQSTLRRLWVLSEEEGVPSRLLARAAGCEILAELCLLSEVPFDSANGGLAPRTTLRCQELMRARLSEDISLDELAAEAQLSPYHFARMFKQSVGVPPRVYFTQLRMEKACELLALTDLPITEIAFKIGYSSSQVLARVFFKYQHMSPSDYRRAFRAPFCFST